MKRFARPIVVLLVLFSFGQDATSQDISGTVTDAALGSALEGVTVFVANTSIMTETDASGSFTLATPPQQSFEVVAAADGYAATAVMVSRDQQSSVTLSLENAAPMPPPEGDTDMSRKNLMKFFESTAFSWSKSAGDIEMVNPEVLQLTHDASNNVISVNASGTFEYDNRALGYKIRIYDFQLGGNQIGYGWRGYAVYIPLEPRKSKDEKNWKKTRAKTYEGSFRHFLKALVDERVKKEEWAAFFVVGPGAVEDHSPIAEAGLRSIYGEPQPIMFDEKDSELKRLDWAGWLRIQYYGTGGDNRWERYIDRFWPVSAMSEALKTGNVSFVKLPDFQAMFDDTGVLSPSKSPSTQVMGYWTFYRMADMLPNDYMPDE